tara:strand:+ start:837 stop:998 length:162 start_codon:yes stop_codon:yes gene_type:complete
MPEKVNSLKLKVSKFGVHKDKKTPRLIVEIPKEAYDGKFKKLINKGVIVILPD